MKIQVPTPPNIESVWKAKRGKVTIHLLCPNEHGFWECKILGKNLCYVFTGLSYSEMAIKAYEAGKDPDYFHIEDYKDNNYSSGKELKKVRKSLGKSQKEFAALLRKKGIKISQSYLSELEAGMYRISNKLQEAVNELQSEHPTLINYQNSHINSEPNTL
ncbi:MAG: helix-turn-helix transcriptional regulator [Spirochaetota bacterium]